MKTSQIHTMVIDDDEVTVMGVKRAFKKAGIDSPLHVARDGIEALEMLRGTGGDDCIPRPHVLFLDLNMPRMRRLRVPQRDPHGRKAARHRHFCIDLLVEA
jgi:CheY-like chemotaxis protein